MTDDVIHSTQYYINYINRAILANLQPMPLKLGRLIVLQQRHLRQKFMFHLERKEIFGNSIKQHSFCHTGWKDVIFVIPYLFAYKPSDFCNKLN